MTIKYNDRWLRIVGYPLLGFVIRHFGEYESVGSLMKQPLYYGDLLWDTLLVATSWEANRKLILHLDQRYSWATQKLQRFVIQVSAAMVITVPIVASMIYLWNEIIIKRPGNFDTGYLLVYDFPLTIVFTLIVHMIYTGMYFNQYYTKTINDLSGRVRELESLVGNTDIAGPLNKPSGVAELLILNFGNSSVPVATKDIAYLYIRNEVSFVRTFDGKDFTSSSSLENLEATLDASAFFRINRQMIANIRAIGKFRSDASGKLILNVVPSFTDEVTVSKKKAAEFKQWIGSAARV